MSAAPEDRSPEGMAHSVKQRLLNHSRGTGEAFIWSSCDSASSGCSTGSSERDTPTSSSSRGRRWRDVEPIGRRNFLWD